MKELSPNAPSRARERKRVLYVEDEDQNWEVAAFRLKERYELERAASAEEACRILARAPERFSAILMDIQLMGSSLDGVNLTRSLKGRLPRAQRPDCAKELPVIATPIIFVTAFAARFSERELAEAGGATVIHKPVDFVELSLALARLCAEAVFQTLR